MRSSIKLCLATVILVSASAVSEANDAVFGPAFGPYSPPLIYNWNGFYVGGHFGIGGSSDGGSGFLGGGQIGFNYQVNPRWVVGIEADLAGTTIKDSVNATFVFPSAVATTGATVSLDWTSTLAARFGYVFDRWLVYGKLGGAWAHASADISSSIIVPGIGGVGGGGTIDQTVSGWVLGLGAEYALRDNWTAKIEYNVMDFGDNNPFSDNKFYVLKAGINYRFGALGWPF